MNFDEFGIRKKDENELISFQREKSRGNNLTLQLKLQLKLKQSDIENICKKTSQKMNAKIFFVVYILGLDARVLTGIHHIKLFIDYPMLSL